MDAETEKKLIKAIQEKDAFGMRELSRIFSDDAVIGQDRDVIKLAIITYAFNKIFSKVHLRKESDRLVSEALDLAERGDFDGILKAIKNFDDKYGYFHGTLIGKSRTKIGSRLYSAGLSLSKSAELSGASLSDILEYSGETKASEIASARTVADRLENARRVLK